MLHLRDLSRRACCSGVELYNLKVAAEVLAGFVIPLVQVLLSTVACCLPSAILAYRRYRFLVAQASCMTLTQLICSGSSLTSHEPCTVLKPNLSYVMQ